MECPQMNSYNNINILHFKVQFHANKKDVREYVDLTIILSKTDNACITLKCCALYVIN